MKTWDANKLANGISKRDGYSFATAMKEVHDLAKEHKVRLSGAANRRLKKKPKHRRPRHGSTA